MSEQTKQKIFALSRGFNGFFCPESRFHLVGHIKPQSIYKHAILTEDIKRGLRSGVLIDVNQVLTKEDIASSKNYMEHITPGERKDQLKEISVVKEGDVKNLNDLTGEFMSEADIDTATKKVLFEFIDKSEGITNESLGLTNGSLLDDVRMALKKHAGYIKEKEQDKETE